MNLTFDIIQLCLQSVIVGPYVFLMEHDLSIHRSVCYRLNGLSRRDRWNVENIRRSRSSHEIRLGASMSSTSLSCWCDELDSGQHFLVSSDGERVLSQMGRQTHIPESKSSDQW